MKETSKETKKKITAGDVIMFVVVYMGVGTGLSLLASCVVHGNPFNSKAIVDAIATGLGLMVGRLIVWAVEYFRLGHTL